MKPRIAWIFSDWDANEFRRKNDLYGGIGYYRVIKPAQYLRKWFDIEVVGSDIEHWGTTDEKYGRFKDYDLIISKNFRTDLIASNTLAAAKHFGKKLIVDIDDDYLNIRTDNPAFKDFEHGKGPRESMNAYLSLADGMIVSTEPLKELYSKLNENIDVLPNCNDIQDWPNVRKMWDDGTIKIGFAGAAGHLADLNLILEPMAYILAKYPKVIFEICGAIGNPETAMAMTVTMNEFCKKNISAQVRVGGGTQAWEGYPELLNSFGWDIVICPLVKEPFNESKSHNRLMETAMIYAAAVASPVYPYIEEIKGVSVMKPGKTGLHAYNSEDWFKHLEFLIKNPTERKEMANNAYEHIKKYWQYKDWIINWKKVIEKYL